MNETTGPTTIEPTNEPIIELDYRVNYGVGLYYPNNPGAQSLLKLANRSKALTKDDLGHLVELLESLGLEIKLNILSHPNQEAKAYDF